MKISYAITVCDEHKELDRLLSFLIKNIREGDEIVVQCDENNTTLEVLKVLNKCADRVKVIEFPLNNHFANFKNNLTDNCVGDYIYQIDADEMVSPYVLDNLPEILQHNSVDVIQVPRINTVSNLTQQHIDKWGWRVNDKGWVNFPDYQWRIYKNNGKIKWGNKVHEVLGGYKTMSYLPVDEEWCLIHPKTMERQEKQNKFYETL
jgi:glycosyltransferase involved in cell wall biosynthesis